jgi:hypothetical protein
LLSILYKKCSVSRNFSTRLSESSIEKPYLQVPLKKPLEREREREHVSIAFLDISLQVPSKGALPQGSPYRAL